MNQKAGTINFNNWFVASVHPSNYGCTEEVVRHERSVTVAQGNVQL